MPPGSSGVATGPRRAPVGEGGRGWATPPVGYSSLMTSRTRWTVAIFVVIGLLAALVLIVRDLRDTEVPEETGTSPALVR